MGKIASIDRGWLLKDSYFTLQIVLVGKIASIDRGWLQNNITKNDFHVTSWGK